MLSTVPGIQEAGEEQTLAVVRAVPSEMVAKVASFLAFLLYQPGILVLPHRQQ